MSRTRSARSRSRGTTDEALVLRRFPYGESSLVCHVLTKHHGKLSVLAKGAYRPKSGYCGVLDLFDTIELSWSGRKGSDLAVVSGASIATRRRALSMDLGRFRAAQAVLELAGLGATEGASEASAEAQHDTSLFRLASAFLDLTSVSTSPATLLIAFDLRFLECLGLAPALDRCASCGRAASDRGRTSVPFSNTQGGRLCERCAPSGHGVSAQPLNVLRVARSLMEAPLGTLPNQRLDQRQIRETGELVRRFLEYHLERRPRLPSGASLSTISPQRAHDARTAEPRPTTALGRDER